MLSLFLLLFLIPYSLLVSYCFRALLFYYTTIYYITPTQTTETDGTLSVRYHQRQDTSGSSIVPRILAQICVGGLLWTGWTLPSLDVPYFYPYPLSHYPTLPPLPPLPPLLPTPSTPSFIPHHTLHTQHRTTIIIRQHTTIYHHHNTKLPINCPH